MKSLSGSGLTLFELIVAACIIFILIGTFGAYAQLILRTGQETALQNELMNIRMSVSYFRVLNGSFPVSLDSLLKKKLTLVDKNVNIQMKAYLESYRLDSQGVMIDSFGSKYGYDAATGRLWSMTKGYETW